MIHPRRVMTGQPSRMDDSRQMPIADDFKAVTRKNPPEGEGREPMFAPSRTNEEFAANK
jgi:hypothetical protein